MNTGGYFDLLEFIFHKNEFINLEWKIAPMKDTPTLWGGGPKSAEEPTNALKNCSVKHLPPKHYFFP